MAALYFYRYSVYERKKRTINIFKNSPADCSLCTCHTGSGISFMEICSICPGNLYSCSSYPYCPIPYIPYCQKNPDCHKIRERKMNAARRLFSSVFILFFLTAAHLFAQDSISPIIIEKENLPVILQFKSRDDAFFKEHQKIVEDNNKAIKLKKQPEMFFFLHTFREDDKTTLHWGESQLISLASRCTISYDTIATLNGIESSTDDLIGKQIIIPTVPGLFIKTRSEQCHTSLEILLHENYAGMTLTNTDIYYNINGEEYIFLTNQRFTPTERAYFLDSTLGLPLKREDFWISSTFGKRKNPVSGEWKDHKGIDLAAAEGTPVYAIKDGYAAFCIENDKTFGNYVILSHDTGKMTSVYAHLSSICVNQYEHVKKGAIIGYVGHTGMATGSHLHFEIRQGGVAQDPQSKMDLK